MMEAATTCLLLDVSGGDERDGEADAVGSAHTAHAVHIVLHRVWQRHVDDVRQAGDVDA